MTSENVIEACQLRLAISTLIGAGRSDLIDRLMMELHAVMLRMTEEERVEFRAKRWIRSPYAVQGRSHRDCLL